METRTEVWGEYEFLFAVNNDLYFLHHISRFLYFDSSQEKLSVHCILTFLTLKEMTHIPFTVVTEETS